MFRLGIADDLCCLRFCFWVAHSLYIPAVCQIYAGDNGLCFGKFMQVFKKLLLKKWEKA